MAPLKPAAEVARWQSPTQLWLDHAKVGEADLEWMAPARSAILWNVRVPPGGLARLPNLRGVSLRGGSGHDLSAAQGCEQLICLDVNQIRGLHDLGVLTSLRSLEFLSLYGLPRVTSVPSLKQHDRLLHVQLGSLKGLETLDGLADAPRLMSLHLSRTVRLREEDVQRLVDHPALEEFGWFAEDVPSRVVGPVMERLGHLRRPRAIRPLEWLHERLTADEGDV
jgi:hypothetical protein